MRSDPTRTRDPAQPEELARQWLIGKWISGVDAEIHRITIYFECDEASPAPFYAELRILNLSGARFGDAEEWKDELAGVEGFNSEQAAQRGLLVNWCLRQTETVRDVSISSGGALCIHFPSVTLTVTAITSKRWSDSWSLSCSQSHTGIVTGETEGSLRIG